MDKILQLRNVSKYYYQNGQVSAGFSKVSLDLSMGEFVVIVGESGSGKSTLLNVLSGLDSYQEGEMYINGEETSHYGDLDFEEYRKKYIGNIFQNFNLINSYTVYQNVELIMLMNGFKKNEIKPKVYEILKQVGLEKYAKQKVSKLSGGQKQRVAIARVLAKDTPIIVADEPTGNLDVESANKVFEILHEISKDKLVVVVTHNYEQVEPYATRKIRMHDGQIVEDEVLMPTKCEQPYVAKEYQNIRFWSKLRLGLRNTFNIPIKFILILMVYLLICMSVISAYATIARQDEIDAKTGYNSFFNDTSAERIVIQKKDGTYISDDDFAYLNNMDNVDYVIKDDILIDGMVNMYSDNYYFWGSANALSQLQQVDIGRMPEDEYEVVVYGYEGDYYYTEGIDFVLDQSFYFYDNYSGNKVMDEQVTVVGVVLYDLEENPSFRDRIYVSDTVLTEIRIGIYRQYSKITSVFRSQEMVSEPWNAYQQVIPSKVVPKGYVYVSEDWIYSCPKGKCANQKFKITASNLYYTQEVNLKVKGTYNKKNIKSRTGFSDYSYYNGAFFVNYEDYDSLFTDKSYQSSVYVKNAKSIGDTLTELDALGYKCLRLQDTLISYDYGFGQISKIFLLCVYVIMGIVLFFIAYFIVQLIYRSRNVYYSIIRILGANKKVAKQLLTIELFTVANLAYFGVYGGLQLVKNGVINYPDLLEMIEYLKMSDYVILYILVCFISLLISNKYAKKIFQKSAMDTYRQGV
ncbi:MAG: ABC transporter ATP-binding protein [Erysipelotrichaceae bacterium]|nr:ABC transporter ATP-binding protein [Erysipelotrichaceae bacterium]